jgi:hypothetical protein
VLTSGEDKSAPALSLRAYARRRDTSVESVRRAIKRGRLKASLVLVNGKPQIGDPDLADREWQANTDYSKAPGSVREEADRRAVAGRDTPSETPTSDAEEPLTLTQATAEEKRWKAKLAELEYAKKSGELVNALEVEHSLVDVFARCRTKLLGVPSKAKAALPHLSHADVVAIDRIIRESLEDLVPPPAEAQSTAA